MLCPVASQVLHVSDPNNVVADFSDLQITYTQSLDSMHDCYTVPLWVSSSCVRPMWDSCSCVGSMWDSCSCVGPMWDSCSCVGFMWDSCSCVGTMRVPSDAPRKWHPWVGPPVYIEHTHEHLKRPKVVGSIIGVPCE